jgi:hypothetical protein
MPYPLSRLRERVARPKVEAGEGAARTARDNATEATK